MSRLQLLLLSLSVTLALVGSLGGSGCAHIVPDEEVQAAQDPGAPEFSSTVPRPTGDADSGLVDLMAGVFVSINWPADTRAGRGVAMDASFPEAFSSNAYAGLPRVWETWKQDWETEPGAGSLTDWNSYDLVGSPPCEELRLMDGGVITVGTDWPTLRGTHGEVIDKVNLVKAGPFALDGGTAVVQAGPNIDPNGKPYRGAVFFDQTLYDCWSDGGSPGCTRFPQGGVCMPAASESRAGALMVKAAWRELSAQEQDAGTYFTRNLLVLTPGDGGRRVCTETPLGLAALHVVYKSDSQGPPGQGCGCTDAGVCGEPFDKWIWATFELVEPQPPAARDCASGPGYTHEPAPFLCGPPPAGASTPSGECRANPIPGSLTYGVNKTVFRKLPAPWNNYGMVARQWYVNGSGASPRRNVANVRLETYSQQDSCMGCHGQAASADRIWSLAPEGAQLDGNPCAAEPTPDAGS